jgi:hypothetical protein
MSGLWLRPAEHKVVVERGIGIHVEQASGLAVDLYVDCLAGEWPGSEPAVDRFGDGRVSELDVERLRGNPLTIEQVGLLTRRPSTCGPPPRPNGGHLLEAA